MKNVSNKNKKKIKKTETKNNVTADPQANDTRKADIVDTTHSIHIKNREKPSSNKGQKLKSGLSKENFAFIQSLMKDETIPSSDRLSFEVVHCGEAKIDKFHQMYLDGWRETHQQLWQMQ